MLFIWSRFIIYYWYLLYCTYLYITILSCSCSSHCFRIFLCNKVPIHSILKAVELRDRSQWTGRWTMGLKISSDKIPGKKVNIHDGWLGPRILECPEDTVEAETDWRYCFPTLNMHHQSRDLRTQICWFRIRTEHENYQTSTSKNSET